MIEAVIFDFDGVVIESEAYFEDIEIRVFKRHGIALTKEIFAEYLGFKLDEYILALENRFSTSVDHALVSNELLTEVEELYRLRVPVVAGIPDILFELQKTYKIALATSRESQLVDIALKRLGLNQYFTHRVCKEDVINGKPDPEVYRKAADLIGADPSKCIVVEDAKSGFKSAKAAGMLVIARGAPHNVGQDFSDADFRVSDMREIPMLIKELWPRT